jgi:hypothetical protein
MHPHREFLKYARQKGITGESESTSKNISENNNFNRFENRNLFTKGRASIINRKKLGLLIFLDKTGCNFRLVEHEGWGISLVFIETSLLTSASVLDKSSSPPDLSSNLISPSSRMPESGMVPPVGSSARD